MNPTELAAEVALAKLDQADASKEAEVKEDVKPEEPVKEAEDTKEIKEEPKEEPPEFTADDALEVAAYEPEAPQVDASGTQLSQAEQAYVTENIGQPLVIRGMVGDQPTEIKIFAPDQIPHNFTFNNQADLLSTQAALSRLENKAEQLLGGYRNQQSRTQALAFEQRENESIRSDVAELQKDGLFPKFKVQPGARGFNDDPSAMQMDEVLKLMTSRNEQYVQEYNHGKQYRHIGFREAFDMWERQQPAKEQAKAQKAEDTERKQVADKVGASRGLSSEGLQKPRVTRGTTIEDIINRYDYELN